MPVRIPLTRGKEAVVDDEDAPAVLAFKWRAMKSSDGRRWYAVRSYRSGGREVSVLMHRAIAGVSAGVWVDHKDGDGLNNRRENLRPCTPAQNAANTGAHVKWSGDGSSYRGVYTDRRRGRSRWYSRIKIHGQDVYLGTFPTEEAAARAYDAALLKCHGEFARLNFQVPDGQEQRPGGEPAAAVPGGGVPADGQGAE